MRSEGSTLKSARKRVLPKSGLWGRRIALSKGWMGECRPSGVGRPDAASPVTSPPVPSPEEAISRGKEGRDWLRNIFGPDRSD
jgi:hypothetical protein